MLPFNHKSVIHYNSISFRRYRVFDLEQKSIRSVFDPNLCTILDIPHQNVFSKRVLQIFLDGSLERSCAIRRVVPILRQPCFSAFGQMKHNLPLVEQLLQPAHLNSHNLRHILALETIKKQNVINAIEEFRSKGAFTSFMTSSRTLSDFSPSFKLTRYSAPRLDVMTIRVFLKSTVRPWLSVKRPSSSTCSRTLKMSGCAFSISSKRMI